MSEPVTGGMRGAIGAIVWGTDERFGEAFDKAMIAVIIISIISMIAATVPDLSPAWQRAFALADWAAIIIFTIEYGLRLWTAREPLKYATSFWGVIDLLAILPFWLSFSSHFEALRSFRLIRLVRVFKLMHYVSAFDRVGRGLRLVRDELVIFGMMALIIMVISAVGIYEFEHEAQPDVFKSIPHALWFTVVTLTTVGYGDIYPITAMGRVFTFLILVTGLGIVAVPTGLIATGLTRARDEQAPGIARAEGKAEHRPSVRRARRARQVSSRASRS